MKKQIILTCLLFITIIGTSLAQHEHSSHMKMDKKDHMDMVKKYDVSAKFQAQLKDVIYANQKLSEAFLNDDKAKIKSSITEFSSQLTKVDMSLLKGDAHHAWMSYSKELKSESSQIIESTDIAKQRVHLAKLNDALYMSLKAFGTGGTEVYYNHCPMANGSGANWLTTSKGIQNPYMGQKMPGCGSNKEVIN